MVHEFRRVSIVYRNVIDSFPANAKRRRLPHPPPFLSFRQLTLEKVGQVKRLLRSYEFFFFFFSFFQSRSRYLEFRETKRKKYHRAHCMDGQRRQEIYTTGER